MHNIKENIGKEVTEINQQFFEREPKSDKFYGWYVGEVVNNNDPDRYGKCQIRVYGIFENSIPDSDLPWAIPDFDFVGSNVGSFIVPTVGTKVRVYFENGEIYLPVYKGKALDINNLPSDKDTDYPNTMVFYETDNGDKLTLNRNNGNTTFTHRSGTSIEIDNNGNMTINGSAQVTVNHAGNLTVNGSTVIPDPNGQGALCAIPFDTLTGLPQVGKINLP